jgi:hypothetical protein
MNLKTVALMALLCACGGGGGGGGDDVSGDDTSSAYDAFLATCHDARAWYGDLGCSTSDEDLCDRDVQWLSMTGDACYDEFIAWWECLGETLACDHECVPAGVDCVAAFCTANPDNAACTGCIQGCPPPPPPP